MNLSYVAKRLGKMDAKRMSNMVGKVSGKAGKGKAAVFCDMAWCALRYGAGYSDYASFEFYRLDGEKRKTYVTRKIQNDLMAKYNGQPEYFRFFDDKELFNQTFREFLHRDYRRLDKIDEEQFAAFVEGRERVMAKPNDGICGGGVKRIQLADYPDKRALYRELKENRLLLVEEFIAQHPKMSGIYPLAANTVRLITIQRQGKADIVFALLRMGMGGSSVDNLAGGGIGALLDAETGKITTPAVDNAGNLYETHPDTGAALPGFEIPNFQIARETVKRAALVVPQVGYIGWDVAITEEGVELIEGNQLPSYLLMQEAAHCKDGIGMLPKLRQYL